MFITFSLRQIVQVESLLREITLQIFFSNFLDFWLAFLVAEIILDQYDDSWLMKLF